MTAFNRFQTQKHSNGNLPSYALKHPLKHLRTRGAWDAEVVLVAAGVVVARVVLDVVGARVVTPACQVALGQSLVTVQLDFCPFPRGIRSRLF